MDFLNHDTPVYSGPERIARMQHSQVYYLDIRRPGRGYYIGKFIKMADDAAECEKFTLTKEYFRLLEESIRRQPQYWLEPPPVETHAGGITVPASPTQTNACASSDIRHKAAYKVA